MEAKMAHIPYFSLTLDVDQCSKSGIHHSGSAWGVTESSILDLVPMKGSETAAWAIGTECIVAIDSDGGTNMKVAMTKQLNVE
jgi:hypothetical protein